MKKTYLEAYWRVEPVNNGYVEEVPVPSLAQGVLGQCSRLLAGDAAGQRAGAVARDATAAAAAVEGAPRAWPHPGPRGAGRHGERP
jgi:hypothetical protein